MPAYLLPSDCGHEQTVEPRHAGTEISCPTCGATVAVPTLRELRQLPPAKGSEAPAVGPSGGKGAGCLFPAAMLVFVLAAVAAAVFAVMASFTVPSETIDTDMAWGEEEIMQLPPEQTFELWRDFEDQGIGPRVEPIYLIQSRQFERLKQLTIAAGSIALVSLLVAGMQLVRDRRR